MESIKQKCPRCKLDLELEEFSKGDNKNGRKSWCKKCVSDYYQETDNKLKANNKSKDYYYRKGQQNMRANKAANIQEYLYKSAKARAKQRNEVFTITLEDVNVSEFCPVLGIKMQYNIGIKDDNSYSLDRIDSTKGYIPGNVCVISLRANRIKNDGTYEEHLKIADFIKKFI